jgi:hypothetical protein
LRDPGSGSRRPVAPGEPQLVNFRGAFAVFACPRHGAPGAGVQVGVGDGSVEGVGVGELHWPEGWQLDVGDGEVPGHG